MPKDYSDYFEVEDGHTLAFLVYGEAVVASMAVKSGSIAFVIHIEAAEEVDHFVVQHKCLVGLKVQLLHIGVS